MYEFFLSNPIKARFFCFLSSQQENDPDKKETKSSDLQGYWDMMYIQIEDVHAMFADIEKLRANNWLPDETDGVKPQVSDLYTLG